MEYRKLGRTDIEVSVICLGTMNMGEQNSQAEGFVQLDFALDQGVNFIDTAELYSVPSRKETYGSTETIIGHWIKERRNRDKYILASKIAGPSANLKYIRVDKDYSRRTIIEALEGSLKRLQTDYIDLYQIHWPARKVNFFGTRGLSKIDDWEDNMLEIIEVMDELIKAGKIRYYGVSNESPWGLANYLKISETKDLPRCVSIQNPYSLLNRTFEVGLSEFSLREDVGLLAYSPLAFGMLTGKYHAETPPANGRLTMFDTMSRYNGETSYMATEKYLEVAKKYNLSPTQMALAFINQQAFITSNIIGATTLDQLQENIGSVDIKLPREVIREINKIQELHPNPAP